MIGARRERISRGDATMGDVAAAMSAYRSRHHGTPVAIDVTIADARDRGVSTDFLPADFKYEDDPAAEFEEIISPGVLFTAPVHPAGVGTQGPRRPH
ncbi:MAG: hypothetical protein EXR07_20765 [Acetobacteraceae bacterium]|nr:hypothetical protein [Acetobacteraceae bacterium]